MWVVRQAICNDILVNSDVLMGALEGVTPPNIFKIPRKLVKVGHAVFLNSSYPNGQNAPQLQVTRHTSVVDLILYLKIFSNRLILYPYGLLNVNKILIFYSGFSTTTDAIKHSAVQHCTFRRDDSNNINFLTIATSFIYNVMDFSCNYLFIFTLS